MNLEGRGEGGRIFAGQAFCPCVWGAWVGPWGYSCGSVYLSQAVCCPLRLGEGLML